MKPKHQRLVILLISLFSMSLGVWLLLRVFEENIVYFYTPSELTTAHVASGKKIRLGGLVETGSVKHEDAQQVAFRVTDGTAAVTVHYTGMLPTLFREGQGVVTEGVLTSPYILTASQVLAKHDENYMPPEVAKKLKETGRWKPQ